MEGAEEKKNEVMEFEDEQVFDESPMEADQELLNLQKRKSVPTVMIQEFIKNDGDISSDEEADGDQAPKDYKIKTHHEIQDVSQNHNYTFI
jgi:hypothetical protein